MSAPMTMRMDGVMRLLSNEYLTRKTTPRKKTKPPLQAKNFTPMKASQSIARRAGSGGEVGIGLVRLGAGDGMGRGGCGSGRVGFFRKSGSGGGVGRGAGCSFATAVGASLLSSAL